MSQTHPRPLLLPHHITPSRERETKLDVYPHSRQATNLITTTPTEKHQEPVRNCTLNSQFTLLWEKIQYIPALSLMSTSSLSSTATLKGLFFVSLVSYGATHRYALDTKGWVTLPLLRCLFAKSGPPLTVGMLFDCRIITLQGEKSSFNRH